MKKLLVAFLLTLATAFGNRVDKGVEVCLVAHVENLDGRYIPQRGIRVFKQSSGSFYVVVIQNGYDQFEVDGGSDFDAAIASAIDGLPKGFKDWDACIDGALARIRKTTNVDFGVLDGWLVEIRVTTKDVSFDLVRSNAAAYIRFIGDRDPRVGKLKALLDAIALELGRKQMAI